MNKKLKTIIALDGFKVIKLGDERTALLAEEFMGKCLEMAQEDKFFYEFDCKANADSFLNTFEGLVK